MSYASLGTVRLSRLTDRHSVTRSGKQIIAHTDEHHIARVRQARAEQERHADPMEGVARVIRTGIVALTATARAGGTREW